MSVDFLEGLEAVFVPAKLGYQLLERATEIASGAVESIAVDAIVLSIVSSRGHFMHSLKALGELRRSLQFDGVDTPRLSIEEIIKKHRNAGEMWQRIIHTTMQSGWVSILDYFEEMINIAIIYSARFEEEIRLHYPTGSAANFKSISEIGLASKHFARYTRFSEELAGERKVA